MCNQIQKKTHVRESVINTNTISPLYELVDESQAYLIQSRCIAAMRAPHDHLVTF